MNSISALMEGIFSFNKMHHFPDSNAVSCRNNCGFIKVKRIES